MPNDLLRHELHGKMLYIYLVLSADDDGFVGNPKKIQQTYTYNRKALSVLEKNGFIITFPNDVCVLTHWNMMNKVPPSKHVDTIYTAEKARLRVDKKGVYHLIAKDDAEPGQREGENEHESAADEQRNRIKENRIEENRNTSTQYILDNHSSETKADKAAAYTAEVCGDAGFKYKKAYADDPKSMTLASRDKTVSLT